MKSASDKLADALGSIDIEELRGSLGKTAFISFRVTEGEKKSLKQAADSLDLTISEYLLKIHTVIAAKLKIT